MQERIEVLGVDADGVLWMEAWPSRVKASQGDQDLIVS